MAQTGNPRVLGKGLQDVPAICSWIVLKTCPFLRRASMCALRCRGSVAKWENSEHETSTHATAVWNPPPAPSPIEKEPIQGAPPAGPDP